MKEVTVMNKMTISVSRKPNKKAALNAKELTIREKFFRMLFGPQRKVMVLVPGDQMDLITIQRRQNTKRTDYCAYLRNMGTGLLTDKGAI